MSIKAVNIKKICDIITPQAMLFKTKGFNFENGDNNMIYTASYRSPIGEILMAEKDNALIGLWIEGQKYFLSSLKDEIKPNDDSAVLAETKFWLNCYFAGENPKTGRLPLAPIGSDFQKAVWNILCEIPYGTVISYGDIAKQIAVQKGIDRMSAQAVGGAVGHNPISIIIPCHRVIGTDGGLTGYAGGIDKKIWLLTHEGVKIDPKALKKAERID